MRVNVRPFAREYKSRSFKAAPQSPEQCPESGSNAQTRAGHEKFSMADLVIATRRNTEVQKEAEAIFRKDACAPSDSEGNVPSAAPFTGRILPVFSQRLCYPTWGRIRNLRVRLVARILRQQRL